MMDPRPAEKRPLQFRVFENPAMFVSDRKLICPKCGEALSRPDVECFSSCPFCGFRFAHSTELEDFILEPEVDHWMRRQPGFTFQFLNQFTEGD